MRHKSTHVCPPWALINYLFVSRSVGFVVAHVDQSFGLCIMFLPLSDFFLSFPFSFPLSLSLFPFSLLSLSPSSFCDLLCYTLTRSICSPFYSLSLTSCFHFSTIENYMSDKVSHVITQREWDENFDQVRIL